MAGMASPENSIRTELNSPSGDWVESKKFSCDMTKKRAWCWGFWRRVERAVACWGLEGEIEKAT